jgi:hypothetical protein
MRVAKVHEGGNALFGNSNTYHTRSMAMNEEHSTEGNVSESGGQERALAMPIEVVTEIRASLAHIDREQSERHRRTTASEHHDTEGRVAAICAEALNRRWNEIHYLVALHGLHRLLQGALRLIEMALEGTGWEIPAPNGDGVERPTARHAEGG